MADRILYDNGDVIANSGGGNAASYPAMTVIDNVYDPARGTLADGDTVSEFLKIPAGSFVHNVMVEVLTGEASVTLDVGDAADPNGFVAAASCASVARIAGAGAYQLPAAAPRFYATDTWLRIAVAGADLTVGSFRVAASIANLG